MTMDKMAGPRIERRTLAALGLGAALAWPMAADAQTQLRFSHYGAPNDTVTAAAEMFKEQVEEETGGEVTVSVHPGNELGNAPTVLQGVRLGTIDMATTGNPYFTSFEPALNVIDLPFLFASPEHAYAVFDGEIGEEILGSLEKHNMKGLALWEIGFRSLTNDVRPVSTPQDLEDLKIRTTPNPAHIKAFELMGANPTPMNFSELYLALETGTVDGQENPPHHIYANRFHEVQDHLSLTEHAYTAAPVVMNRGKFEQLTVEQQEIVIQAAKDAAAFERDENAKLNEEAIAAMKEAGMQVVEDPDRQAFRKVIEEEVRQGYIDEHGDEVLNRIDEMRPQAS